MDDSLESGGVVKKKSSSGCLIIKKKGEFSGSGVGPSVSSRITNKEFGSADESMEHSRAKNFNDKVSNDPIVYSRKASESSDDRKRSRMDLFEFDEYDEFDMRRIQNEYMAMLERKGGAKEFGSGSRAVMVEKRKRAYFDGLVSKKSGKTESNDHGGRRRYDSDEDDSDEDEDEDEVNLPVSSRKLKSEESDGAVRLQSKSGVLKVMVNKKKKMDTPSVKKFEHQEVEKRKQFQSKHDIKKKISVPSPVSSDSERSEKKVETFEREERSMKLKKVKVEKHMKSENIARGNTEIKLHKSELDKSKKIANTKSDWTERSIKPMSLPILPDSGSMKAVKREEKKPLRPENVSPVKVKERKTDEKVSKEGKEEKNKRGGGGGSTEKQKLRENIREMLIKAGWKIDYRPRRGRDYLDSVYISPSGTGYWSIIKAYEAFQKQMPEVDDVNKQKGESSSFAPLSDDLIKKLTRKTRKKMEEEMKKNSASKKGGSSGVRRSKKAVSEVSNNGSDDDDQPKERLGSSVNGKAKKVRLHEEDSDSGHGLSSGATQARKARKIGRCTLLARNPEEDQNSESDGYIASSRKRTLLAWLIDTETVQLSEKVQYMNRKRTRVKLEGWITREGIHCGCCSKILTISKFELHAGSKLRQPLQNVVLESGISLLECLLEAWNKQDESLLQDFYVVEVDDDDPDDDTCGICADGGDLICCDGCPSTFHQKCLGIKMLPDGDWHCPNCTCKFCGTVTNATENSISANELQTCSLCERKYHKSCNKGVADTLGTSDSPSPYCGKNCQEIHDGLQKILGVKHELQGGLSWSLLHRTDLTSETESRGYPQRIECNSKLAVALSVMDECFLPIIDRRSGINQIHNIVYNCGSNFNRLNYRGFYTVVLERGDEIISAASIRLRGTQLAEMPFIGTRNMYRRQGMCRQLLSAVESVLSSLKIEKLVIPAISEHIQTWTGVFGFKPLENSHRKELKSLNMLVFPGVDMLQKPLKKLKLSEDVADTGSNESSPRSRHTPEASDIDSSGEETKVQVDIASGVATDSDSSAEETKLQVDIASGVSTDVDSSGEETKAQVDTASGDSGVEPQVVRPKRQSPAAASLDSVQLENSAPRHLVRNDGQSSAKDLADCSHTDGSLVQCRDAENSSVVDAKSELQGPTDASNDVGDEHASLKLSNGRAHEAEEDNAPIEQRHRSSVEASITNGVEQAAMELPSVSKTGDNVPQIPSDFNQDKIIAEASGDVHDSGNGASDCIPMEEESVPNLADESRKDVDPSSACAPFLQSSDGKTDDSYSNSAVETIADAENQLSAADSSIVFDKNSEKSTIDHTLDTSATHPADEETEIGKNEDANLFVSLAGDPNQQPSSIEVVNSTAVASENVSGETVADEIVTSQNVSGEKVADEIVASEKNSGETVADEIVASEKNSGETHVDEIIAASENISGETHVDESVAASEKVSGETVAVEIVASQNVSGETVADLIVASENVSGETVADEIIASENLSGETVADEIVAASENVSGETVADEIVAASENISGETLADEIVAAYENVSGETIADETVAFQNVSGETVADLIEASENVSSETVADEIVASENVSGETVADEIVDASENVSGETVAEEIVASQNVSGETVAEEIVASQNVSGETVADEIVASQNVSTVQTVADEIVASENVSGQTFADEIPQADPK